MDFKGKEGKRTVDFFFQDFLHFKVYRVLVSSADLREVNPWG